MRLLTENIFLTIFLPNLSISQLPNTRQLAVFAILFLALCVIQRLHTVYAEMYSGGGTSPHEILPLDLQYIKNSSTLNFNASNYLLSANGTQTAGNGLRLLFQLYDVKANQSIPFVTYLINITRISANDSETTILNEMFQVPSAQPLVLDIQRPSAMKQRCQGGGTDAGTCEIVVSPYHVTPQNVVIHANPGPLFGAWIQNTTGKIQLDSSKLLQSGKYNARISIVGVFNDKTIYSDQTSPKFEESWALNSNSVVVPEFPTNLLIVGLAPVIAVVLVLSHRYLTRNQSTA